MELRIYSPQEDGFLRSIEWNFDELKQEVTKKANDYMNLVYSDDQVKEAKKDRASLRKFNAALNDKRKEIKKQIMAPYTAFDAQIKELTGIVDQAIENIDTQVKGYEEAKRNEKLEKVKEVYKEAIGDLDRTVPFEKIFQERWLNVSTTLKSIKEEISGIYEKVDADLKLINNDGSLFVFEMKEEYLKNFDLQAAMALKQRLEENEKKKAAFEAQRRKEEEERQKRLQEESEKIASAGKAAVVNADPQTEEPKQAEKAKRVRLTIQITANEGQFEYLNSVLNTLSQNAEEVRVLKKEEL